MTSTIAPMLLIAALLPPIHAHSKNAHYDGPNAEQQQDRAAQGAPPTPLLKGIEITATDSQTTNEEQSNGKRWMERLWTDPIALFTAILTVIAVIQIGVYCRMNATTKRAERAYVYVDAIVAVENFDGEKPTFSFTLRNAGRTPATIIGYNAAFWPGKLPRKMPLRNADLKPINTMIVSQQEIHMAVGFETPITSQQRHDAIHGKETYMLGRVRYRDRFQRFGTRYTNFTFQFDPRPDKSDPRGTSGYGFNLALNAYNDSN